MTSRPSRLTLRRRLVLFSAPVALIVLIAAVKMISVVVAGNSAVTNFRDGDGDALGGDSSTLNTLNVIERAKAPFTAGTAAVLQGRLEDADARFSEALSLTGADESCPVLVNLRIGARTPRRRRRLGRPTRRRPRAIPKLHWPSSRVRRTAVLPATPIPIPNAAPSEMTPCRG